jgi:hypothetical protein
MSIVIPIVSEFQGKGFKQAEKQTSALSKSLKGLAVTLGAALSARKIAQFTKSSVKAFIEEDKAIRVLSNNLQNLGLAYDIAPIEKYIREMQYATGVADNELRPAYQKLANATKNLSATQEILGLALDISAGTGKSLSAVTDALSRAYLGNNTSLSRLNLGIKKADLASKSFSQITEDLSKQFSGSAAKAADTYAGKLAILTAAAGDAQEILGGKLIQSLELLAGKEADITKIATVFENMAVSVGNVALGLADTVNQIKTLFGLFPSGISGKDIISALPLGILPAFFARQGKKGAAITATSEFKQSALMNALAKERGMLASRNFKIQKNTTKELEKQNKLKKDDNRLAKAGSMLDLEKIQIEAALQNNLTDNERLRLQLMKALVNENASRAEYLAKELEKSQNSIAQLKTSLTEFKPSSPFDEWIDAIERMRLMLSSMGAGSIGMPQAPVSPSAGSPTLSTDLGMGYMDDFMTRDKTTGERTVNVYVSGSGGLDAETKQAVVDAVVEASAGGYSTGWYRTTGLLSPI